MGINFKAIDTMARYAEKCGVKTALQTKVSELYKVNFRNLEMLKRDTVIFTNTQTPFVKVPYEDFHTTAKRIAKTLSKEAEWNFSSSMDQIKNVLPNFPGEITGRTKTEKSILSKIFHFFESKRDLIKLEAKGINGKPKDLLGARGILNTGNPKEVDAFVKDILKAIDEKKIKLDHFYNNGKNPYLTEKHCLELEKRGARNIVSKKISGYTCAHFYFKDSKGHIIEFQLRGPKVNRLAEKEHLMYKLYTRILPPNSAKRDVKIASAWHGLTNEKYEEYKKYIDDYFVHNRNKELGIFSKPPKLPAKIPHILSMQD